MNFFFFIFFDFEFITSQLAIQCLFKMSYRLNFFCRHRRHPCNVEKVYLIFALKLSFQRCIGHTLVYRVYETETYNITQCLQECFILQFKPHENCYISWYPLSLAAAAVQEMHFKCNFKHVNVYILFYETDKISYYLKCSIETSVDRGRTI